MTAADHGDWPGILQALRERGRDNPMPALLWLACVRSRECRDEDERLQEVVSGLLQQQRQRAPEVLLAPLAVERLAPLVLRLLPEVAQHWERDTSTFKLDTSFSTSNILCHGVASSLDGFELPTKGAQWTLAGLALNSPGYGKQSSGPLGPALWRSAFPAEQIVDLCSMRPPLGMPHAAAAAKGAIGRPLALLAPAYVDRQGSVHDVSDLLGERLDSRAMQWLCRQMLRRAAGSDGMDAVAACWGAQVARVHDMAAHDYRPLLKKNRQWGVLSDARDPIRLGSAAARAIVYMVDGGAAVTPTLWGEDRGFIEEGKVQSRAIAQAVMEASSLSQEGRLECLQRLRALGHDVVVAHRDATGPGSKGMEYPVLPLVTAVRANDERCALALLDWGADPHAKAGALYSSGTSSALELADDMHERQTGSVLHEVIRAHEARWVARQALTDIGMSPAKDL